MGESAALKHVLVVDDDPTMRELIGNYLESTSFRVTGVADGGAMAQVLKHESTDLVLLDLKLGQEDGLDLMRHLGTQSDIPVIILTGHRSEEADRVVGLELGADDYLLKPFGLRELLARIRAVLRRSEAAERRRRNQSSKARYRFAGWELNMATRRLTSPLRDTVPLTAGELNLLAAFLRAPRQVLSREQLLAASRVHDEEVFDRSIDVQILRLRRKLELDPSAPALIRTERGAGYTFAATVETL